MPPKKTCKVVVKEGQRGARIAPKGCKVRTRIVGGVKTRTNKMNQIKRKAKTDERSFYVKVGRTQAATVTEKWKWDTGAEVDTMSYESAERLGILAGQQRYPSAVVGIGTVGGSAAASGGNVSFEIRNITLWVTVMPDTPAIRVVTPRLHVFAQGRAPATTSKGNLLGVPTIKQLSKVFKIKFQD